MLLKKKLREKTFIEQIIEFEVRGHGPPGRTCTPPDGYFHDKAKIYKEYLRVDYFIICF